MKWPRFRPVSPFWVLLIVLGALILFGVTYGYRWDRAFELCSHHCNDAQSVSEHRTCFKGCMEYLK